MGIALGLAAALSWGLADYFAALASRRTGALRVVLGFHLLATALLAVLLFASGGGLSDLTGGDLAWFAFLGVLGWLSYLAFYRALAIGPISIVSPIVSAYAAVTVVCAVLISGERLSAGEALAIAIALLGVLLASSDLAQIRAIERVAALGIVLALATAVLIGAFVFGVAYFSDEYGWLVPIFLARALLDRLHPRDRAPAAGMALPGPVARPPGDDRLYRGRRHDRLCRFQLRRPARRHVDRGDRGRPLLGRADRGGRRAHGRASEHRPSGPASDS